MEKVEPGILKKRAQSAARNSYAPYSNYHVGAAVLADDERIFTGCNIESSTYGLSICAERSAIFSAIVSGCRKFKAMAIFSRNGASPCGACRQVIWDMCGDIPIYVFDDSGGEKIFRSSELLPHPFDKKTLEE